MDQTEKVKEEKLEGRPGYVVDVLNTRTDIGAYQDSILIETDSRILPQLELRAFGNIYDPSLLFENKSDPAGKKS